MDTEPEELQFQGPIGICRESCKLLVGPWRRLFGGIALAFALPLSLAYLSHVAFTDLVSARIGRNTVALEHTRPGSVAEDHILSRLSSEWGALMLFKVGYLLAVLVLSLFSTAAAVYSVACAYTGSTGSPPALRKVLTVVPRVWRRLAVTFLWSFAVVMCYNVVAVLVIVLTIVLVGTETAGVVLLLISLVLYLVGLVYIGVVWHLACVVSVLEEAGGLDAMHKSRRLLRGKLWTAVGIFLAVQAVLVAVEVSFRHLVVRSDARDGPAAAGSSSSSWVVRSCYGAGIAVAMTAAVMLGLVAQTVVYFVCKAYHHENIDKSGLAGHLEEYYLGEYMPLKAKDVQMESFQV